MPKLSLLPLILWIIRDLKLPHATGLQRSYTEEKTRRRSTAISDALDASEALDASDDRRGHTAQLPPPSSEFPRNDITRGQTSRRTASAASRHRKRGT